MLKLAFCGNDCNTCERYIATQSGSIEQLKEVAALWKRLGYRENIVKGHHRQIREDEALPGSAQDHPTLGGRGDGAVLREDVQGPGGRNT